MAGDLDGAAPLLERAAVRDPDDEVASLRLSILEHLRDSGGTYSDYLARPADREELDRLADDEDWEAVEELCSEYNRDRLGAWIQDMLVAEDVARLTDRVSTLVGFFNFVSGLSQGPYLLHEYLDFFEARLEAILHKFVFKFGDVDEKMIDELHDALCSFFGCMASKGVVRPGELQDFVSGFEELKPTILDKMKRYNAVRHDPDLDEAELEAIREEIFEGDHLWPFL